MDPISGDPRRFFGGRHRERGETKWTYGYTEIAEAAGLKLSTVRRQAHTRFDPRKFTSVVEYIMRARARQEEDDHAG